MSDLRELAEAALEHPEMFTTSEENQHPATQQLLLEEERGGIGVLAAARGKQRQLLEGAVRDVLQSGYVPGSEGDRAFAALHRVEVHDDPAMSHEENENVFRAANVRGPVRKRETPSAELKERAGFVTGSEIQPLRDLYTIGEGSDARYVYLPIDDEAETAPRLTESRAARSRERSAAFNRRLLQIRDNFGG